VRSAKTPSKVVGFTTKTLTPRFSSLLRRLAWMPPAASTRSGWNETIFSVLGLAKSPILGSFLAAAG